MSKYLEYILKLKDQMTGPLKKVTGVSNSTISNVSKLDNKVNQLDKTFSRASGGGISRFNIAMGNLYAQGIARLGDIVGSISNAAVDGTIKREQDIIGLTTFLGDNAREVYNNIQKDAAATPFGTQALLDVNKALISSGVNAQDARKDTLNLANAISAVGKGNAELSSMAVNMQQIKILGKATAMDIRQFGFAGINIYEMLSKATGKSVAQVQDMEVSYDLLSYAMEKAAGAGGIYEGALEKQSKTLGAMIETAKDNFSIYMADLGDSMRPMLERWVGYFQKFVSKIPQIFAAIQPAIKIIGDLFFILIDAGVGVVHFFQSWYQKIKEGNPIIVYLTALLVGVVGSMILMELWSRAVRLAVILWTGAQWLLNAAINANPIGILIAAIIALGAIVGYIIYRYSGWGEAWANLMGFFQNNWSAFQGAFSLVWLKIQDMFLSGIEKMQSAWYEFKGLWDEDGAKAGLESLKSQSNARAAEIAASQGKVEEFKSLASASWSKIGLKDTGKGVAEFVKDAKSKLGMAVPTLNGAPVNTNFAAGGEKSGAAARNKSETVATGGTKSNVINITIGKQIESITVLANNLKEGAEKIRDIIVDEMSRAIAMSQAIAQ